MGNKEPRAFCTKIIFLVINSERSGHGWGIILKWISKEYDGKPLTGFVPSGHTNT